MFGLIKSISGVAKSLFGVDAVANSAAKIVDKIAGTDFTPKEKADFILKYQESTKHQSPVRRVIAVGVICFWLMFGLVWLVSNSVGRLWGIEASLMLADDVEVFMVQNLLTPTNIIIGFYFASHIISGARK